MKILVTGGAGYIGGFMVKRLLSDNHEVFVADSLARTPNTLNAKEVTFYHGDLTDKTFISTIFEKSEYDAVIHFAGYISMGESMENPGLYFENNVQGSLNVLENIKKQEKKNFIFSSTAGVYGNPTSTPITEDHPKNPTNPYGESKLITEQMLSWYHKIFNISFAALRYFNAAGGALDGTHGENHDPETHIIPNAIRAILQKKKFILYGDDYPTKDGTCVRDYIHVLDLVEAHILALNHLHSSPGSYEYNVGTGKGYSNKEVLDMIQEITGEELDIEIKPRREGDADTLIADSSKIKKELGFNPHYSDLHTIIETAWKWHQKNS